MEVGGDDRRPLLFGGALPVQSVQALAAKNLGEIPQRYIRPEIEAEPVRDGHDEDEIPILDLSKFLNPQHYQDEAAKLKLACEEWGFFQLINHGVPDEVIERMKSDIEEFFQLPLEEKMAFAQLPGTIEGYGQVFVHSEDQKLDWGDRFSLFTQPVTTRNMGFWPIHPPTFRAVLDKYSTELKRVTNGLLGMIATNLGLVPEKLTDMFKEGLQSVRMNYYPPCPYAEKVLGLSPHSDADGLTLLLQVNQVQGLEIKKNGEWIPIKPLLNAFIVNIGDILEIMSNGRCKSIEHRAIISTEKERLSIAAFHYPNLDALIGPLLDLTEGSEENYKTLSLESYMRFVFSCKLAGKSILDHMKLNK